MTRTFHLYTYDHWCIHSAQCGNKIVEQGIGPMGKVRKLVLASDTGKFSRFIPTIDQAIAWAVSHNAIIPQEDIDECRRLIS